MPEIQPTDISTEPPLRKPAEFGEQWVLDTHARPVHELQNAEQAARVEEVLTERVSLLRSQIIRAYDITTNEEGGITDPDDKQKVEHRMSLLGMLAASEPDPVNLARARSFADDFARLVWKDAYKENELFDVQQQASHDTLTGLLNRRGLAPAFDRLTEGVISGRHAGLAVLYLDLDKFKAVNDAKGHTKGDEILSGVSAVLAKNTRKIRPGYEPDVIVRAGVDEGQPKPEAENARVGGDEFIVLVPLDAVPVESDQSVDEVQALYNRATEIGNRLGSEITRYMRRVVDDIPGLGVSVGVEVWQPGTELGDLLNNADSKMYSAKQAKNGKN